MDHELKEYLDGKFAALDGKLAVMDGKFKAMDGKFAAIDDKFAAIDVKFAAIDAKFAAMIRLIEDTSASLQREIGTLRDTLKDVVRRLDRQAGLIQTGSRHTARMIEWSENVDVALHDLKTRVQALETPDKPTGAS